FHRMSFSVLWDSSSSSHTQSTGPVTFRKIACIGCISIFWFPFMACTTAKRYGECFCLPLIDEFGLMRVSMRLINDCLLSYFCCPCAWCQMSQEMDAHETVTSQPS
uniref:Uncharacterized protein n=1 Tax=Cyprinus carpio TaxID=7962 RepID=A0A8C1N917_CYPCA